MFHMNALMMSAPLFTLRGQKYNGPFPIRNNPHSNPCMASVHVIVYAVRKNSKVVSGRTSKARTLQSREPLSKDGVDTSGNNPASDEGGDININTEVTEPFNGQLGKNSPIQVATRTSVLQACIVTSGLLFAFGSLVRQASHIASMAGWGVIDSSTEVSFGFEMWHIELIVGLVVLITTCRYVLLKTWPDFTDSSETANQQILSLLQPLDYIVVAFLPGISEELLFRGALLPLFGLTWKSALVIGAAFGALHLGSGRRYSFAVWATFVGFAYGLATIYTSTVFVPMASHALNNLAGGILWRYTSKLEERKR